MKRNGIFVDIARYSEHSGEEEVSFDQSTCFRIDSVQESREIWINKMSLSDEGQNIAQGYFKEKHNETENGNL